MDAILTVADAVAYATSIIRAEITPSDEAALGYTCEELARLILFGPHKPIDPPTRPPTSSDE